jgi:hypothetical protein
MVTSEGEKPGSPLQQPQASGPIFQIPLQEAKVVDYPKPKQPVEVLRSLMRGEPLEVSIATLKPSGAAAAPLSQSIAAALASVLAGSSGMPGDSSTCAAAAIAASGGAYAIACGQQAAAAGSQAGPQMVCDVTVS